MNPDPFDLQRFVRAQEGVFDQALAELHAGRKHSHWIWFVFPQVAGLGHSDTSRVYAISGVEEARAYLAHPLLGPRLEACTLAALPWAERGASALFGYPDDLKFHSSMTLFALVAGPDSPYARALAAFFDGEPDAQTPFLLGTT